MKSRQGFVSNSSSASFVIVWRYKADDHEMEEYKADPITYALNRLYDYPPPDLMESIKKATSVNEDGELVTGNWIVMYNDLSDFSETVKELVFALYNSTRDFEVIEHSIDSD